MDDYMLVFDNAPVALCVSEQVTIQRCNVAAAQIFRVRPQELAGQLISCLYPTYKEFNEASKRIFGTIAQHGIYQEDQILVRSDGEHFWCSFSGTPVNWPGCSDRYIWVFVDISATKKALADLSPRERQVAASVAAGKTSKMIAAETGLSPRTIEYYRSRLMRKLSVSNYKQLITSLVC